MFYIKFIHKFTDTCTAKCNTGSPNSHWEPTTKIHEMIDRKKERIEKRQKERSTTRIINKNWKKGMSY